MAMTSLTPLVRTDPTFKADVDTFFATDLPLFVTEANALETNVNAKEATASAAATTATTQAGIATASATSAAASANFKGEWSTLTGALNIPASVSVSGVVYMLLHNIADVTASNPTTTPADWTSLSVTVLGVGGTTTEANITLTSASAGSQSITPTDYGQYVKLPDATTMQKGALAFSLNNTTSYPIRVLDSAGTLIQFIPSYGTVNIGLSDNSTSVGIWNVGNKNIADIVAMKSFSTTEPVYLSAIDIDSNRELAIVRVSNTDLYGIIFDKTTYTWGAATLIRTGANSYGRAIKTATDQALVISCTYNSTALQAVVLTISGTSITVNTAASATLAGAQTSFGNRENEDVILVGSTVVFSYERATTTGAVRAITISGTTVTIGNEYTVTGYSYPPRLYNVADTTALCISFTNSSTIYANVLTISGTTITVGTSATVTTTASTLYTSKLGSRWVMVYANTTAFGAIVSVSGTTVTISAGSIGAVPQVNAWCISNNKVAVSAVSGTNFSLNTFTDNAGTISIATPAIFTDAGSIGSAMLWEVKANSLGLVTYVNNARLTLHSVDISGTDPVISMKQISSFQNTELPSGYPVGTAISQINKVGLLTRNGRVLISYTGYAHDKLRFFTYSSWKIDTINPLGISGSSRFWSGTGEREWITTRNNGYSHQVAIVEIIA